MVVRSLARPYSYEIPLNLHRNSYYYYFCTFFLNLGVKPANQGTVCWGPVAYFLGDMMSRLLLFLSLPQFGEIKHTLQQSPTVSQLSDSQVRSLSEPQSFVFIRGQVESCLAEFQASLACLSRGNGDSFCRKVNTFPFGWFSEAPFHKVSVWDIIYCPIYSCFWALNGS